MRRKIVAQQNSQHLKKQMNQTTGSYREGTPKMRKDTQSTTSIPQIGPQQNNRVKSSRQSQRQDLGIPINQRAITPKKGQKLYSSITVGENNRDNYPARGMSQSKLNSRVDKIKGQLQGGINYTQSMQNINPRLGSGNNGVGDYQTGNGMQKGQMTVQLNGILGGINSLSGMTKSSKVIPKKHAEWRGEQNNFNTT